MPVKGSPESPAINPDTEYVMEPIAVPAVTVLFSAVTVATALLILAVGAEGVDSV